MMNTKMIIAILVVGILCVDFGQGKIMLMNRNIIIDLIISGLSCYQHDYCLGGCPALASSIVQCESSQSKCWVRQKF